MSDIQPAAEPSSTEPTGKEIDLADPEQVRRARELSFRTWKQTPNASELPT
jgi:hypothetical protein